MDIQCHNEIAELGRNGLALFVFKAKRVTNWGYSIDEAEKLARVTTLFQTVGDNMTTDSASQAMISTLKGYEMGVDEAEDIVDRYNEVLLCAS